MKAKFKTGQLKTIAIVVTIFALLLTIMFFLNLLFTDDENAKKKESFVKPQVTYINQNEQKRSSFKKTYGDRLSVLERAYNEEKKEKKYLKEKVIELEKKLKNNATKVYGDLLTGNDNIQNNIIEGIKSPAPSYYEKNLHQKGESLYNPFSANKNQNNMQTGVSTPNSYADNKIITKIENDNITFISNSQTNKMQNTPQSKSDKYVETEQENEDNENKTKNEYVILPGSFVPAIFQNGIDAPASGEAKQNPHPVSFRITDTAKLPNKFQSDLIGCFGTAYGYGELASERGIFRVEDMACIKNDGTMLVSKGKGGGQIGYITGEDGKIGLLGRVVSKQGQILARTMAAGFISQISDSLKANTTTQSTSALGTTTTIDPNKLLENSLYGGVSKSAKSLTDFYLKLNDMMFPVIEINAGRKCDIVFTKPVMLEEL